MEKPWAVGALAAFVFGLITHLFGLVNVLQNCDDVAQEPAGYGTGITSGRFVLSIVGDIVSYLGGNYNLPWVNGVLFLMLIAASAGLLIATLHIKSIGFSAVIGMLFVAFPTATSTLLFRYTSVYYGLGVLLAVMAAWVIEHKNAGGGVNIFLSAVCTALSLGIYQAYTPITIAILLILLIQQALTEGSSWKQLLVSGIRDCMCLILGLVLYYILLKLALAVYKTELSDYQGMQQMGQLNLGEMPGLIYRAAYSVLLLPLRDYCGVASEKLLKEAYLLIYILSIGMTGYLLLFKIKKISIFLLVAVFGALFPVAVNFIVVMCPDSWIYTLMVYSFALVPCLPIVLCESLPPEGKRGKRVLSCLIGGVIAVMALGYSYQANVNYTAIYYANRQMENYLSSLVTQIRMTEGFSTEKKWAFIGDIEDPLLNCYWKYELTIGGAEFTEMLLNRDSRGNWIQNYYGYLPTMVSDEELEQLKDDSTVQAMPCWPNEGSIKVIGDTVVVKFQETESS